MTADWCEPATIEDARKIAGYFAKSGLVPSEYSNNPERCFIAMMLGHQLGIPAFTAIQNITVVKGKPSVSGRLGMGLVKRHPEFEMHQEGFEGDEAWCEIKRKGQPVVRKTFSLEDARRAGLLGKDIYKQYPKDMLMWRARGRAVDAAFPDATLGLPLTELALAEPERVVTARVLPDDPDEQPETNSQAAALKVSLADKVAKMFGPEEEVKEEEEESESDDRTEVGAIDPKVHRTKSKPPRAAVKPGDVWEQEDTGKTYVRSDEGEWDEIVEQEAEKPSVDRDLVNSRNELKALLVKHSIPWPRAKAICGDVFDGMDKPEVLSADQLYELIGQIEMLFDRPHATEEDPPF